MSRRPEAAEAILALAEDDDLKPLDGFPGAFIRKLSIGEMDRLAKIEEDSGAQLIIMAVVDGDGKRLFAGKDVDKLTAIKAEPFRKLVSQVAGHNGMGASAAEDAVKN